jgi:hypothetical protein
MCSPRCEYRNWLHRGFVSKGSNPHTYTLTHQSSYLRSMIANHGAHAGKELPVATVGRDHRLPVVHIRNCQTVDLGGGGGTHMHTADEHGTRNRCTEVTQRQAHEEG